MAPTSDFNGLELIRPILEAVGVEASGADSIVRKQRLLDEFTKARITDVLIPFPKSGMGLPSRLRDEPAELSRFNEAQGRLVELSGSCLDDALEEPDGYEKHFHLSDQVVPMHYFGMSADVEVSVWDDKTCSKQRLGSGGFGMVFNVPKKQDLEMNRSHNKTVALKLVVRATGNKEHPPWKWIAHVGEGEDASYPDSQQKSFQAEVEILRKIRRISAQESKWNKLKKDHIVKIRTSFTTHEAFGILLSPVAFCSLEKLLQMLSESANESITFAHPDEPNKKTTFLRDIFHKDELAGCVGCLASSVGFLHKSNIRHKDLKTGNVLVYPSKEDHIEWKICLCDFATASDYSDNPDSLGLTKDDVIRPRSRHIDAPEITLNAPRTIAEDMWHLGCMFLEILLASRNKTKEDLLKLAIPERESSLPPDILQLYHRKFPREALGTWLDGLESNSAEAVNLVIEWVKDLMVLKPRSPPPFFFGKKEKNLGISLADFDASSQEVRILKD